MASLECRPAFTADDDVFIGCDAIDWIQRLPRHIISGRFLFIDGRSAKLSNSTRGNHRQRRSRRASRTQMGHGCASHVHYSFNEGQKLRLNWSMALVQRHFFCSRLRRAPAPDDSGRRFHRFWRCAASKRKRNVCVCVCVCVCSFLRVGKSSTEFAFHKFDEWSEPSIRFRHQMEPYGRWWMAPGFFFGLRCFLFVCFFFNSIH